MCVCVCVCTYVYTLLGSHPPEGEALVSQFSLVLQFVILVQLLQLLLADCTDVAVAVDSRGREGLVTGRGRERETHTHVLHVHTCSTHTHTHTHSLLNVPELGVLLTLLVSPLPSRHDIFLA